MCPSDAAVGQWNYVADSWIYLPVGHIETLLCLRSFAVTDVLTIRLCRVYCVI